MFVEVDDRDAVRTRVTRKLSRGAVSDINKSKIGKIDADERNAWRDVVLQTLSEHRIVASHVGNRFEFV